MKRRSGAIASISATLCLDAVSHGADPGEPDPSFQVPTITGGFPTTAFVATTQPDGKILVGGNFRNVAGAERVGLARLNADGSLDTTFIPATIVPPDVRALLVQPDGRIVVGIGNPAPGKPSVLRLEADGSLDKGFNPGFFVPAFGVLSLAIQADGKLLAGETSPSTGNGRVARLLPNGQNDGTFNFSAVGPVESIALRGDGRLFVAGGFTYNHGLVNLATNGSAASIYLNVGSGFVAHAVAIQTDGKLLLGGSFTNINSYEFNNLARFGSNGVLEAAFYPGHGPNGVLGPNGPVRSLARQPDGQILCAGSFTRRLLRVAPTGANDPAFANFVSGPTYAVAVQDDDRVVVGGSGALRRALPTTGWDVGFVAGPPNPSVRALLVQPDGKILAGGDFTAWGGVALPALVRLNPAGDVDYTFKAGMVAGAKVAAMLAQPDGKLIVGGAFMTAGGAARVGLARLNPDGTADPTFEVGSGFLSRIPTVVAALALQSDGKVLVGGGFVTAEGMPRAALVRLNPDGHLDSTFNTGAGPDGPVYAIAIQDEGDIVIAGDFNNVDHQPRDRLARLFGDHPTALAPRLGLAVVAGHPSVTFPSEPGRTYILESTDTFAPAPWSTVASVPGDGTTLSLADPGDAAAAAVLSRSGGVATGGWPLVSAESRETRR